MLVSSSNLCRLPSRLHLAAIVAAVFATFVCAWHPAAAQGTHLWTQSQFEEFEKGTPQGVSLTSDGQLREGPGLTEVLTTPSSFVWSVAVDKSGVAYVGTGSPATVLRVGKDGKPFTLFECKDVSVQVVRVGPDGWLYVATLPSGTVYKLKADAEKQQDQAAAIVVFDAAKLDNANSVDGKAVAAKQNAHPHYIWNLTFDSAGRLYIAAGDPGAVYRVDPAKADARAEEFFKSDEAHIRSLAWDAKGNLIAGSDGTGLVYRIDANGKGYVLFEAPRREVTAVAVGANGTIYAASVGDKNRNPLPPLPVQGVGTGTITIIQPGSLQAANASSSVPEGTEIWAIAEGRAPRKIWAGKDEIVYALAARADGLMALSGNRGRIFRIQEDGNYADIAHLTAQQGLSMAAEGTSGEVLVGTGNTGKLFRLGSVEKHEYASSVLDAGALARFGRVEVETGSSGYEIWTRSGNVEQPVRGWTDWQAVKDGTVASPAGRFLQWKAVLHTGGTIGGVGVNYLPVNAAPVVDDLVVVTGARVNQQSGAGSQQSTVNIAFGTANPGAAAAFDGSSNGPLQAAKDRTGVTARWAAHDDNGDELSYGIYLRGDGETVWRLLKDKITDKAYSFDATLIPDGGYQVKVIASDAASHTPGDALAGEKVSDRFEVDTTPPVISGFKASGERVDCEGSHCPKPIQVSFDAEDAFSAIAHAEYSLDAGPWQYVEPVGKLSDSRREHYEFRIWLDVLSGKTGEHLITVRAYDRHDNVGVAKTVIAAQEK